VNDDERFIARAAALSHEGMERGAGGPFGALVVREGRVLAEGWNEVTSSNDPTAHAEIVAIRRACAVVGSFTLDGATVYASCEPCPMCLAAIHWARCARIVFANTREDAARIGFDDDHIYREIPKPLVERALPILRLPHAGAAAAFALWTAKADRVEY
jgi:tRNA(Arg) A34 adenosine deaminase TadA